MVPTSTSQTDATDQQTQNHRYIHAASHHLQSCKSRQTLSLPLSFPTLDFPLSHPYCSFFI